MNTEKTQTAVEWLFEQVCNLDWKNLQGEKKKEILDQAKAMEKQQIIDAWDDGFSNGFDNGFEVGKYDDKPSYSDAEDYYNQTYQPNP